MSYSINYHTGAGGESDIKTVDDAMQLADEGAVYTQQPISVDDEDGKRLMIRRWYGCLDGIELQSDPIQIGELGFYADWTEN